MPQAHTTSGKANQIGRRWRLVFAAYALCLTTGLLWPALQVPAVVHRPDLIVHGVSFGLFTWLGFMALREGGRRLGPALLVALLAGVAFGGITELLQGLPLLKRTCAWDDFFADALGVALGVLAAVGVTLWNARKRSGSR